MTKFFVISELTVNYGIRMHGFTINLIRVLVYIDPFFLLYSSETSYHTQYTVTDLNK